MTGGGLTPHFPVLRRCSIVWVDGALHALGEARCRQARERSLSLTDGVSIEVMRQERIREVIAQDQHFTREGFHLPLVVCRT